ncbi:MAG: helix-turn-helix domain-containing protein [Negativibacillus sp.]|nr:helix-turn-helix domain-containing protein [Negativibacillus sp.]
MNRFMIGDYIRTQREAKGINQDDLCRGICNRSTLSRIERGRQEPSYYTLKVLLQRLGIPEERFQILMGPQEFEIEELQQEIVADNVKHDFSSALKKIERLETLFQAEQQPVLQQFVLRVRALAGYEKDGQHFDYDYSTQREMLTHALELTCAGINLKNMGRFLLGEDEAKIINQIAITYSEEGNRRQAIEIYRQLIRYVQSHFAGCEIGQIMLPLTAYNYSKILGLEHKYKEAIEVAELGRQCCVKYNKCRMLGGLLLNIACCLHEMGEDERSWELLIDSYYVNKAMERTKSCETVKQYAKENLRIEIG